MTVSCSLQYLTDVRADHYGATNGHDSFSIIRMASDGGDVKCFIKGVGHERIADAMANAWRDETAKLEASE